mmetsp:Transcript_46727/g.93587  ORF Transcript_46727/g.93587 Transcript_46727/m.93587 type:complete len:243 (-) Transcript_46727:305-1033(-)
MGAQSGKEKYDSEGENGQKKKVGSFMNCTCGKGRDDKDEVQTGPGSNGTRLTEEEWAAVRTGRLDAAKLAKPDLLSDGTDMSPSRGQHRKRLTRNRDPSEGGHGFDSPQSGKAEGREGSKVGTEGATPPTRVEDSNGNQNPQQLRFAVGDRVRCACSRWGNEWEAGNVVKTHYREPSWPASKPSAPYQVKLDKGALIYAPEDIDDYIQVQDESWAKQLPPGAPWYLQPGALDRELAKVGAYQ